MNNYSIAMSRCGLLNCMIGLSKPDDLNGGSSGAIVHTNQQMLAALLVRSHKSYYCVLNNSNDYLYY